MSQPPKLSEQERSAALAKSRHSRRVRASVKARVKSGELSIADVLLLSQSDSAISKMRVLELVESIPGMGKIRATSVLERIGISLTRRVQGLGIHQRRLMIEHFEIPTGSPNGRLIVLSGPGGVGKSTVAKAISKRPDFWLSVSATTRSPRVNEVEGVDYFFYTNQRFDEAIANGELLEWTEFAGNRYGTPRIPVQNARLTGRCVLLEIEIDGAKQVKSREPGALLVFLEPPTWEELVSRLEGRGTDSPERRAARLALAQEEMAAAPLFDKVLINDQVETVVEQLVTFSQA